MKNRRPPVAQRKKKEKGEGKKGRKGRPSTLKISSSIFSSPFLVLLSQSPCSSCLFNIEEPAAKILLLLCIVQCLLLIQLLKRLSFPFTYFAIQNARKVQGNRRKVNTNRIAALLRDMCERMRSDLVVAASIWLQLSWFGSHTDER
jgi:hypothetical protein